MPSLARQCAVIVFVASLVHGCAVHTQTTEAQLLDGPGACTTAAAIAHRAKQLCSAPIDRSLQSVFDLGPDAARVAGQALRDHGFRSSLDLALLDGRGSEAEELLAELKRTSGLNIGDRARVRLLMGDRADLRRLSEGSPAEVESAAPRQLGQDLDVSRRLLQEHAKAGSGDGMSADTIAIVLSVLVGAAGYLVQVITTATF